MQIMSHTEYVKAIKKRIPLSMIWLKYSTPIKPFKMTQNITTIWTPYLVGLCAATAADWTPAVYSNYGPGTTICAPGGDQDYYYDYESNGQLGAIGCVLSTMPKSNAPEGYGYMEGTSMACPHVSGVLALALSYAAEQHRHVKATEVIELLHKTATPVEPFWNMDEPKYYYKYVADLGTNHKKSIDLKNYYNKMGHGQVNAYALLKAIEGAGEPMTFPNVYVATSGTYTLDASIYFDNVKEVTVNITDGSIAKAEVKDGRIVFTGLAQGQTDAKVTASGKSYDFVVTVRNNAAGNGWL